MSLEEEEEEEEERKEGRSMAQVKSKDPNQKWWGKTHKVLPLLG